MRAKLDENMPIDAAPLLEEFEQPTAHYIEAHNDYLQLVAEGGWQLATVPARARLGPVARGCLAA